MLRLGVAGIGGYAGSVCDGVRDAVRHGDAVQFVAACDPRADLQPRRRDLLVGAGIPVLEHLDDLLRQDIDAVWLPIPIPLHRPYTEQALAAGKAVLVEKPAAGSIEEVDAMIRARDRSGLRVAVGFQTLFDANVWAAKRLVLDGAIGTVRSASVLGCWPRSEMYYARASWAGRLLQGETWVLDSPLSNALAHYANLALFLLGDRLSSSASPSAVEAELFRAYPIENFDTCCVRVALPTQTPLVIAFTHACAQAIEPTVTLHGTLGTLRYFHAGARIELTNATGEVVRHLRSEALGIRQTLNEFARLLQGATDAHYASLENARCHTLLVNAVSEAADIVTVPTELIETLRDKDGAQQITIRGIEKLLDTCTQRGQLISEVPGSPLVAETGRCVLNDYRRFAGPRTRSAHPRAATAR